MEEMINLNYAAEKKADPNQMTIDDWLKTL